MRPIELLAPAGSFESLRAALQAGADSVYFGVEQLNMRARSANNFSIAGLPEIQDICRQKGVRTYLALNTILYGHDLQLMRRLLDAAREAGIDAVIAMDPAAMLYARQLGIPVHLSTQVNITNLEAVQFYAPYTEAVVLSRELSLSQVADICRQIESKQILGPSGQLVRVEVFAHGALCMAVSGKCYLSLHTHNASANRGACKQNCRRTYTVKDDEGNELLIDNEYIMSPKDLSTIGFLDKLAETGVSILKIEGRSKGPDYVYETTACYREALQALADGSYGPGKVAGWLDRLSRVYNRGFWDGYYLGQKMGEWTDAPGSKAAERKVLIGIGVKYFGNIGVGEFVLQSGSLKVGDEILITGPTTGLLRTKVNSLQLEGQAVGSVGRRGVHFSMPVAEKVRPSDKLYKIEYDPGRISAE
ncbi:MAG: U32 family peptidase [Phaeodactylibacter sp.]|nr:U32 family peptidase [Phaeodactylibacter sp.]MCB9273005.1 U32 family peptidase [Lewinellaceae bacterium]